MSDFYVYAYIDPRDGTPFYIGKGKGNRLWRHLLPCCLRKRTFFYNKINKMHCEGIEPTIVTLVEGLSEGEAHELESFFIKGLGRRTDRNNPGPLCNLTNGGEGCSGRILSDETRCKISASHKGRTFTEEHCRKMSEQRKGIPLSKETRQKMSESSKGQKHSAESRLKMSEAMCGRTLSDEHRRKLSDVKRGTKHTPETRHRISEALKGRTLSQETKQKISIARRLRHAFDKEPWRPTPAAVAAYCECLAAWLSGRNSSEVCRA